MRWGAVFAIVVGSGAGCGATSRGTGSEPASGSARGSVESGEAASIPALKVTPLSEHATGFDLQVTPSDGVAWKLDDQPRTEALPARVRGLTVGMHTIEIVPPAGFLGRIDSFRFSADQAIRIDIHLMPSSTPAVTPVADGPVTP